MSERESKQAKMEALLAELRAYFADAAACDQDILDDEADIYGDDFPATDRAKDAEAGQFVSDLYIRKIDEVLGQKEASSDE